MSLKHQPVVDWQSLWGTFVVICYLWTSLLLFLTIEIERSIMFPYNLILEYIIFPSLHSVFSLKVKLMTCYNSLPLRVLTRICLWCFWNGIVLNAFVLFTAYWYTVVGCMVDTIMPLSGQHYRISGMHHISVLWLLFPSMCKHTHFYAL